MNKRFLSPLKNVLWLAVVFVIAAVLFKLWIPNLTSFENPLWDESDRARDAMEFTYALLHFDLFKVFDQVVLFQTWGPLYAVLAQIPIFVFGPEARSLAFVSFFTLIASTGLFFWSFKKATQSAFAAFAVCSFIFFWIVGFTGFSSYWLTFMLEGWTILGWIGVATAGVSASVPLLVGCLWVLFLAKFQYFPIFFLSLVAYLFLNKRVSLALLKDFFRGRGVRIMTALLSILVLHIVIMKVLGPVYGKPTWAGYRSLRNPLVVSWMLTCGLLFANRKMLFEKVLAQPWEKQFIKWFGWPACLLMAFPYPNRWGAVAVTQSYVAEKKSFFETLSTYSSAVAQTWTWPTMAISVLCAIVIVWASLLVWGLLRFVNVPRESSASAPVGETSKYLQRFDKLSVFVFLLFAVQILVLLGGVNNTQPRYAWVPLVAMTVGMLIYSLKAIGSRFGTIGIRVRQIVSVAIAASVIYVFAATTYFQPTTFFLTGLQNYVGLPYQDHPDLFPLDRSLEPVFTTAAGTKSPFHLGILQDDTAWYWYLPLRYWRVQNMIKTGREVQITHFARKDDYCDLSRKAGLDAFVESKKTEAGQSAWVAVTCGAK